VVTLDADGAFVATKDGSQIVESFRVQAVDTTGAGDSFWGGFLCAFCESEKKPAEITIDDAAAFARFGNAVASLCVRTRGAIPAMPSREAVEAVLSDQA
jgi:fructokinase